MASHLEYCHKSRCMSGKENAKQNHPFESDTARLVHKHLTDPNHVITDEELANIRIGMSPGADAPTEAEVREHEDWVSDQKADSEKDSVPGAQKTTPWDTIDNS